MGRDLEVERTSEGFRAMEKGKTAKPAAVTKYLAGKFCADLELIRVAIEKLAVSMPPGRAG